MGTLEHQMIELLWTADVHPHFICASPASVQALTVNVYCVLGCSPVTVYWVLVCTTQLTTYGSRHTDVYITVENLKSHCSCNGTIINGQQPVKRYR